MISRTVAGRIVALTACLMIGYAIPIFAINDGSETWAGDPAKYRTAVNALGMVHLGCEFTNIESLIPRIRVVKVQHVPGSCQDAAPDPDIADYIADVRLHTLFGIPTGTLRTTCGGNAVVCSNARP